MINNPRWHPSNTRLYYSCVPYQDHIISRPPSCHALQCRLVDADGPMQTLQLYLYTSSFTVTLYASRKNA